MVLGKPGYFGQVERVLLWVVNAMKLGVTLLWFAMFLVS
jgi:hypothetical protein